MKKILIVIIIIIFSNQLFSQNYKFGKVSKEELEEKYYPLDSSANAAVLYKKRRSFYIYNSQTGWVLNTYVHERIKIYNKQGYKWATKKIKLYVEDENEAVSIKAFTFNLAHNKIEKTKLKSNAIFEEDINKYWKAKKFTMPNLKEGTIIEWEYTIRSPYYSRIDDMVIQYDIPIKLVISKVETPEYFVFKNMAQGYFPMNLEKSKKESFITINSKSRSESMNVTSTSFNQRKINFTLNTIRCENENVPALLQEPFVNNMNNYRTLLKFELAATRFPNSVPKLYNTTWEDVTKTIYNSSNFGAQIKKKAHLKEDLVNITGASSGKIGEIYQLVKNKIKWNGYKGKYTTSGVRKAYKDGIGNVAEINLNLVSMLREAGFNANPILVSTRDNGIPVFPTTDGFNYVIVGVESKGETILLDASERYGTPNMLPLRAMNWKGRIVRKDGSSKWVNLISKQYATENSTMQLKLTDEGLVKGMCRITYSNYKALAYRNKFMVVKNDDIAQNLEEKKGGIEILNYKVKNKSIINKPVEETFEFTSEDFVDMVGNKIYFKPLFFNAVSYNPFKLDKRDYPVDFGTPISQLNRVNVTIPEGYEVEFAPSNLVIGLPNNYGIYEFKIVLNGKRLSIMSKLEINTAIIPSLNYNEIKEFYKIIVTKNMEQIILKKV